MSEEQQEHAHPDNRTYLFIAAILTVVTAFEFGALYIPGLAPIVVPLLLSLSAAKFSLVVGYYMHLKPDPPLFRWVFLVPLSLAMVITLMLLGLLR